MWAIAEGSTKPIASVKCKSILHADFLLQKTLQKISNKTNDFSASRGPQNISGTFVTMDLLARFLTVSNEVRRIQLMNNKDIAALVTCLQKLEKELSKSDTETITIFTGVHYEEITRIVKVLRSLASTDTTIRSLHDKIFGKHLQIQKRVPSPLTLLFQEFIKGVTYFQHQGGIEVPIYHRINACGPGDNAFREAYQRCTDDLDDFRAEDIKKRIETCFIERLVYDKMYRDFELHFPKAGTDSPSQDDNHNYRLQITMDDFATCFPHIHIDVNIVWDNHMPIQLVITRRLNGNITSVETYHRNIIISDLFGNKQYDPYVECFRETEHKKYYRTQRFDYLPKWKEI